jgi:small subunit ribosomal protein S16
MPVRMRMWRAGQHKSPFYRIVVANSTAPVQGKYIECLGSYNPIPMESTQAKYLRINTERVKYWLVHGAEPTQTVARLLGKADIIPAPPVRSTVLAADVKRLDSIPPRREQVKPLKPANLDSFVWEIGKALGYNPREAQEAYENGEFDMFLEEEEVPRTLDADGKRMLFEDIRKKRLKAGKVQGSLTNVLDMWMRDGVDDPEKLKHLDEQMEQLREVENAMDRGLMYPELLDGADEAELVKPDSDDPIEFDEPLTDELDAEEIAALKAQIEASYDKRGSSETLGSNQSGRNTREFSTYVRRPIVCPQLSAAPRTHISLCSRLPTATARRSMSTARTTATRATVSPARTRMSLRVAKRGFSLLRRMVLRR